MRINEDFIDNNISDSELDLASSVALSNSRNPQQQLIDDFLSGKYKAFLRLTLTFPGEEVLSEKQTREIINNFAASFKRFVQMCPYLKSCSDALLCSKMFLNWTDCFCNDIYDNCGIIGFQIAPTMRKKDLLLLHESIWKLARPVLRATTPYEKYHIASGFDFLVKDGDSFERIGSFSDLASPCFSKEKICLREMSEGHLDGFDDFIEMSWWILDKDMTKEEQYELCKWAIARNSEMSKNLTFVDKAKRLFKK